MGPNRSCRFKLMGLSAIFVLSLFTLGCRSISSSSSPVINSLIAQPESVRPLQVCQLTCSASDADNDALSYRWSANRGNISGEGPTVTWTAPETSGTYTITIAVSDTKGNQTVAYLNVQVVENHPPTVESLQVNGSEILVSNSYEVDCLAFDPDGDELTYEWSASDGNLSGQGRAVTWSTPHTPHICTIEVKVTDGQGGEDAASLDIEVLPINNPPTVEGLMVSNLVGQPMDRGKVLKEHEYYLECQAWDPDGDKLSYQWWVSEGKIVEQKRNKIRWRAPDEATNVTVRVTVTDERGAKTRESISLKVVTTACELYR